MITKRYLGIDESNHGRYPEIFVGVLSVDPNEVVQSTFEKLRGADISDIMKGREFRHILIGREIGNLFTPRQIQTIVIAEFIKHYSPIEDVYVDGPLTSFIKRNVADAVSDHYARLQGKRQGDEKFPLIHIADAGANALHRLYQNKRKLKRRDSFVASHLLNPDFSAYSSLLGR